MMEYTFRRTRLSALYEEIGKYLKEHGDADIRSIVSLNGDNEASYRLELSDLMTFDTKRIGEVKAKYEDVQYTKEEWESGVIKTTKVNEEVLNTLETMNCCLRENDLCGMTVNCVQCSYMKKVIELWKDFCDTPAIKNGNYITEVWNNFPIGTFKADIIDWFRQTYDVDVYSLEKITGTRNGYYREEE